MSTMPSRRPPDALLGRWDPQTADVLLLQRILMDGDGGMNQLEIVSNVRQEIWLWPDVGHGWGPRRREGYTLAVNILHRLVSPSAAAVCDDWHVPLATDPLCLYLALPFQERFLVQLPPVGGRLPGHELRAWLEYQRRTWRVRGIDLAEIEPTALYPVYP